MVKSKDTSPSAGRGDTGRLPQAARLRAMRALAHPLRLRLVELLAERPRTTLQAAAILGQPPTRLYHHVHALEAAGLLRVRERRKKRGTEELTYEVVGEAIREGVASGDPATRRRRMAIGAAALDATVAEWAQAMAGPVRRGERRPLVARLPIRSGARALAIRREILALLERYTAAAGAGPGASPGDAGAGGTSVGRGEGTWTLTVVMLPPPARARRSARGKRGGSPA